MTGNLTSLPTEKVAEIANAALSELARRAGVTTPPRQLDLIPPPAPIDPAMVDLEEIMPNGKPRFMFVKEASSYLRISEDALIACAKKDHSGFQIGGRGGKWVIDMTKKAGRG
ncbi:hypothetical protein [Paenochrobactrum glaciei]|uniref:DNA-binding protein n=1 Tax=Paenochrobactrum glaciei TaxID=486407 RepID=A0ABN1GBA0_9HYPH